MEMQETRADRSDLQAVQVCRVGLICLLQRSPDDGLQELHLTGEIVSEHETRGDLLHSCSRPFKPESALLQGETFHCGPFMF